MCKIKNTKNINDVINDYKTNKSCKIDIRPIEETPFKNHIATSIRVINDKEYSTDLRYTHAVFDDTSNNFHVFPNNSNTCSNLKRKFDKLRHELVKQLKEFTDNITTVGSGNTFTRYNSAKAKANDTEKRSMIYKFVEVKHNNVSYTINFMRYMCDKNGVVGCTMCAIQFHKAKIVSNKSPINCGKNGFEICYTKSDEDYECCTNSNGNVCFNPPVKFPTPDQNDEYNPKEIDDIIKHFLVFIELSSRIQ